MKNIIKVGIIAVAVCVLTLIATNALTEINSKRKFSVDISTSLEKVLDIQELHTVEYTYNSYAIVYKTVYGMDVYNKYHELAKIISADRKALEARQYKNFDELKADAERKSVELGNLYAEFYSEFDSYAELCEIEELLKLKPKKADKKITTIKYAVSYEGIVRAGIDENILFEKDEANKKITVKVPRVKILDTIVTIPSDKTNKSLIVYDNKSVADPKWVSEAHKLCKEDLKSKIDADLEFLNIAQENAVNTVKAFVEPFRKNTDYDFEIVSL